ncbi:MAG: energy transducer TonB [Geothrix sp.]|nr:energy transducer TonB [Geothrix sp.]
MFSFAPSRGQGPVFEDLPPTLQPCAIAAAAPPQDHLRTAALSGLIYLLIGGAALAFSSLAPPSVLVPGRSTEPERIVEFGGPPMTRPIERIATAPRGSGGSDSASALNAAVAPRADPDQPAATLPTEDHRGDPPATGSAPSGRGAPADGAVAAAATMGPVIHDFSMTGLAVLRRVDPLYPDFARWARIQGPVVLMMTVDERGQPVQVQVLEGHRAFHEVAVQAARQWRFEPARLDGRPVAASFRLTLKFSLR